MMINHIITSSLVIVFVLLIGTIFENKISACMKYSLWLLVIFKLLLPIPGVESKIHIMNYIRSFTEVARDRIELFAEEGADLLLDETLVMADNTSELSNHIVSHDFEENLHTDTNGNYKPETIIVDETVEKTNGTTTVFAIIKGVYLAGVFGTLSVIIISNLRFSKSFKKKRKYIKTYKGKLPVYKIEDYYGAWLYGGFSPAIIVGNNKDLTIEQQHMILLHEYIHYMHGDHIWFVIRSLCVVLYWYNPLVWLAVSVSRRDSELACDESTMKRIGKKQRITYGQTLLEIVSKSSGKKDIMSTAFLNSTTAAGGKDEMKKRILMISKGRKTSRIALILAIILSVVCIGCTFGEPVKEGVPGTDSSASVQKIESNDFQGSDVTEDDCATETILEADEITQKYTNVYDKPQKDKICILIQPSELRKQLNYYYIPEDKVQEDLKKLLYNTKLVPKEEWGKTKGKLGFTCGWSLEYDDKQYEVFESGYMLGYDNEALENSFYEQNPELIDKVNNLLVQELNYGSVDINTIMDVTSATLSVKASRTDYQLCEQTITDKDKLKALELWFRNAKRVSGGYDCENASAALVLKTSNGEEIRISLAADGCTVFAINGVYYDYKPADKKVEVWYRNHVFDLFDQIPNAFEEEVITYNGKEYKKSELSNATLQWLELSELERSYSSYFPPEFLIFDETWGITLEAENITPTGLTIVCTQSGGEPTGELQTGGYYFLEKWTQKNGWQLVPCFAEITWAEEAWIIPINDTCQWEVNWKGIYGELSGGKYRIGKIIEDFRGSEDFDTATYYAEFYIE